MLVNSHTAYLVVFVSLVTAVATQKPEQHASGPAAEARFLGQVRTTTYTAVSVATSTAYFSCISDAFLPAVCSGKRRKKRQLINKEYFDTRRKMRQAINEEYFDMRRKKRQAIDNAYFENDQDLTGSLDSGLEKEPESLSDQSDRSGKVFGFTIWTAVTQSTTVTVVTTDTATTIRMSFYCTAALATGPSAACPMLPG